MTSSFRWPLAKLTHSMPSVSANRWTARVNRSLILPSGVVEAIGNPSRRCTYPTGPAAYCNLGWYTFRFIRSRHSTSKTVCPAKTSATVRATVMMGSGQAGKAMRQPTATGSSYTRPATAGV